MTLQAMADVGWQLAVQMGVQFTLLVAIGALLHWLLRERDPRIRHALWLVILLRIVVPIYPTTSIGLDLETTAFRWIEAGSSEVASTGLAVEAASPGPLVLPKSDAPRHEIASREMVAQTTPRRPPSRAGTWQTVRVVGLVAWLVGVALGGGLLLLRVRTTAELRKKARPSSQLTELASTWAAALGLRRAVPVLVVNSERLPGPILVGARSPKILVPELALSHWSKNELDAAVLHEVAHVRRGDLWVCLLQEVVKVLFFFHPLVWWVSRRISFERELCCDDAVLRLATGRRQPYLRALLRGLPPGGARAMVGFSQSFGSQSFGSRAFGSQASGSRNVAPHTVSLGVASSRSTVSRRIRRMVSSRYSVPSVRPVRAIVAVLVLLLVSAVLLGNRSAGERSDVREAWLSRVAGMRTMDVYFLADESGAVNWQEPIARTGDVSRTVEIPGDASFSKVEIRPHTEGTVRMRALVDIEGAVRSVEILQGIHAELDKALLAVVREKRFERTVHKTLGPVAVGLLFELTVEPENVQREVREDLGEVVEVLRSVRRDSHGGIHSEPVTLSEALPDYLEIQEKAVFEGTFDARLDGDYNFILLVNEVGAVATVELQALPRTVARRQDLRGEAEQVAEGLTAWAKTFRFIPVSDDAAGPLRMVVAVDLRVANGAVRVATYAPVGEEWREKLHPLYGLEEGQNVKLILAPVAEQRLQMFRWLESEASRRHPNGPSSMQLFWNEQGLVDQVNRTCYGTCDIFEPSNQRYGFFLRGLSESHGVQIDLHVAEGVGDVVVGSADILTREGATAEELLDGFATELHRILQQPVRWERTIDSQDVWVLRGSLGAIQGAPGPDGKPFLDLFAGEKDQDSSGPGFGFATDAASAARMMELFLNVTVVDETTPGAQDPFAVRLHRSAVDTELLSEVARNVEEQTGLEVSLEQRPFDLVRLVVGE